jgi:hypothetical protein
MIISDIKKATANKSECRPSRKATDVVMAETRAAWLEGIPPVRQAMVFRISLPLRRCVVSSIIAAFTTWARNQALTAESTIGFSTNALTDSVRIDIATDIIA